VPVKFDADVRADKPGMFTWPGDSRYGIVSLRFSCAVNPLAAHSATPSDPLPKGSDWVSALFGRPRTTSDRETTPPVFIWTSPFCHAVVTLAAAARGARLPVTTSGTATNKAAAAAGSRRRRGWEPGGGCRPD